MATRKCHQQRSLEILNQCQGFSMVELLVSVLIFAVITAGLHTALFVGDVSWQTNSVLVELQQEARKAMDWMKDDLREAGQSSITDVPADGNWYNTITFKTPAGISGGNIVWSTNPIQFQLSSNQLQRIVGAQTRVIALDINSLQFRRLAGTPNIVEISLQTQKSNLKGKMVQYDLDFKVRLRN